MACIEMNGHLCNGWRSAVWIERGVLISGSLCHNYLQGIQKSLHLILFPLKPTITSLTHYHATALCFTYVMLEQTLSWLFRWALNEDVSVWGQCYFCNTHSLPSIPPPSTQHANISIAHRPQWHYEARNAEMTDLRSLLSVRMMCKMETLMKWW